MPVTGASAVFAGNVGDAILSADSASLFVSSGNAVVQLDVATGKELARFDLGTKAGALDVSPDGKHLVAVEADTGDKFAFIDLARGLVSHNTLSRPGGPAYALRDVSFAGNSVLLFSQVQGPVVRYVTTRDEITSVLPGMKMATLISSDDHTRTYVLDSSFFHQTAILGNGTSPKAVSIEFPDPYAGPSLPTVMQGFGAISRDGSRIYQGEGGYLRDGTLTELAKFGVGGTSGFAFTPKADVLYSLGLDGNLIAWNPASGEIKTVYFVDVTLKPTNLQFGADQATQLGNVLQITDDGQYALAITADGISRFELGKLAPMSSEGDDIITVGNTLYGLGGNDTLGGPAFQTLIGGKGDDIYLLDPGERAIEDPDSGTDLVRTPSTYYELPANIENLTSTAKVATFLTGNALANVIRGGSGDDTIDGAGGNDVLVGGMGRDTASFDSQFGGVTINLAVKGPQATAGGGSVTLAGFENLAGTMFDDVLIGDKGANVLSGEFGNDRLDGRAGADTMDGGYGDDLYIVDNAGDIANENIGDGHDTVRASVSHVLGDAIEDLVLTGTQDIAGTGNTRDNRITGNAGDNELDGRNGKDILLGGAGDDTLVGSDSEDYVYIHYGDDTLDGGSGSDTVSYAPSYAGVTVSLLVSGAQDTVNGGVDTLISIENLIGSAFADQLTGNGGANRLEGGDGDDRLTGGAGDDALIGGLGSDTASYAGAAGAITVDLARSGAQATGGGGTDTLVSIENLVGGTEADKLSGNGEANRLEGGTGTDRLTGRGGNDWLDGGIGQDVMIGGSGDDTYVVDNNADSVSETASGAASDSVDAGGRDTVRASVSFSLVGGGTRFVEVLALTGTNAIDATGNDLANELVGNGAANRLDGGKGADVMRGGAGDDVYIVDSTGDVVDERQAGSLANSGGHDRVEAGVNFSLAAGGGVFVEDLVLTGQTAVYGYGNALDNRLQGNAADNRLFGGAGADTLIGGAGSDLVTGGAGADRFVFESAADLGGKTRTTADAIGDFSHGEGDRIDLSGVDAKTATAGVDDAFSFIGTGAYSGVAGELRVWQTGGSTWLGGDTDGDKASDFVIKLVGLVDLVAGDLVL